MGGMGIMGGRGKAKKIAPWGAIFMGGDTGQGISYFWTSVNFMPNFREE